MKYKGFVVDDNTIENIVDKLGVSMVEAADMWLTDNGLLKNEEVEEMTAKAKENRISTNIHDTRGVKNKRKAPKKKENPLKKEIISAVLDGLMDFHPDNRAFFIRNDEKYIDFTIAGREFTINLVEHRPKKK